MENLTSDRLVHYYDTERRRILCGRHAAEDRSTKHARGITCGVCIALLRERADAHPSAVAQGATSL